MKLIHTADYYQTKGARELCHKFKNGDPLAISTIATYMSYYTATLPLDGILIPIPSHNGLATTTCALANQISKLCGLPFADIIQGQPRETIYTLKQDTQTVPDGFFGFQVVAPLENKTPVLVDAVYDTGQTAHAASQLFPDHQPIIFTYARVL